MMGNEETEVCSNLKCMSFLRFGGWEESVTFDLWVMTFFYDCSVDFTFHKLTALAQG